MRPILACVFGLLLAAPPRNEIAYSPAEGLRRSKVFVTTSDLELVEVRFELDGEKLEGSEIEVPITIVTVERVVVTDEVKSLARGKPTRLSRTFDELLVERTIDSPEGTVEVASISDFQGVAVVFVWDEDEEAYSVETADEQDEVDEELLEGLLEDMSLRGFLPVGEVAEGDSWEVDAEACARLMWPGGQLGFRVEDEERDPSREEMTALLSDGLEADITATFEGVEDADGARVAVISLVIEAGTEGDIAFDGEGIATQRKVFEFVRELEGRLLWDLDLGVFHSLELSGDASQTESFVGEDNQGDRTRSVAQRHVYEGTIRYSITAESGD